MKAQENEILFVEEGRYLRQDERVTLYVVSVLCLWLHFILIVQERYLIQA